MEVILLGHHVERCRKYIIDIYIYIFVLVAFHLELGD